MRANQLTKALQQERVHAHVGQSDAYAFFNLLTGPQLVERVEALLPEHRERAFLPTGTLAMFFAQALLADGRCRGPILIPALATLGVLLSAQAWSAQPPMRAHT
jgi:hypothetical protein